MDFSVEVLPTLEAAEERLTAFVGAHQRDPLGRVNVLTGSNVQRLYFRRVVAHALGQTANVRFFTPVDLAAALRLLAHAPAPPQRSLPDGGEALVVAEIMRRLHERGAIRRLDPAVQGVPEAVAASLRDLREGELSAPDYAAALYRRDDPKLHELGAIYDAFESETADLIDRPTIYQDAVDPLRVPDDAVGRALGGAPLAVVGIYDATPIQVELIRRCAAVRGARLFLVAPADPAFAFARDFAAALRAAGATIEQAAEDAGEFAGGRVDAYFSAPSRQAEAEEIARRILALAHDAGVPFGEIAVLHRLDHAFDDLLEATLRRAEIPVYRAAGRPLRHTAVGRALLVLLDLVLETPTRARLLEFLASPALKPEVPPGRRPRPVLWERVSKHAGLVSGWDRFRAQLARAAGSFADPEGSPFPQGVAQELGEVVAALHEAAARAGLTTWRAYCDWFLALADRYLDSDTGDEAGYRGMARARIQALAELDTARLPVDARRFQGAAARALRRAVLSGGHFQQDGVFLGSVTAARSLRFEAVFLAECAERIFPPLIRQDPLLLDHERDGLNRRLDRIALPLKRGRSLEERMLFGLVEQAATRFLTLSWARRTSATGAPRLPSTFLLESIREGIDELARVRDLEAQGIIRRMPVRLSGAAPLPTAAAANDWSATRAALDSGDLRLALIEGAPTAAQDTLRQLWPDFARYEAARSARNAGRFTEFDGVLPPERLPADVLERVQSATAMEEYAACPYRYFMRHVLGVRAVQEPGDALEMTPLDRGALVHRILERWVTAALEGQLDWPAYLRDEEHLLAVAEEAFADAALTGLVGLPTTWEVVKADVRTDLRRVLESECQRADQGYRPVKAEMPFTNLSLPLPDGSTLRLRGRVDRVDEGPDGLVAIDYKTGRASKEAQDYASGSALQLPVYLHAVAQEFGRPAEEIRAEYWYASHRGEFKRSGLRGAEVLASERFHDVLSTIADGIRQGRFFPYPGEPRGRQRRPNCTFCDYNPVCATDVDRRFEMKARQDQPAVRRFLTMQAR